MRKLLTPLAIEKLQGAPKRQEIADAGMPGLRLVIQPKPSGAKSWCIRYRYGGRPRKLTLGSYPLVDIVKARQRAKDALEAIERGEDPGAEKKALKGLQHQPAADRDAFGVLIRLFFHHHAIPRTRSWRETARLLGLQVDDKKSEPGKPPVFVDVPDRISARWAERPVTAIRRRDIIALLDQSKARGATTTANRELSALSRFFSWCCERDILDASPVFGIRKPAPENRRERVLSDDELALVWKAAVVEAFPFGDLVRLLILTAQRRIEVAGMSRSEFNGTVRSWNLPGERTKNKRPHVVPLGDAAIEIIDGVPKFAGGDHLFGMSGRGPFSGFSRAKAALDAQMAKIAQAEIKPWTLHDLRRTAATRMGDLGVLPHVVEAVLNHVSGSKAGVAGIYNLALYEPEKRAALELWGDHVSTICGVSSEPTIGGAHVEKDQ